MPIPDEDFQDMTIPPPEGVAAPSTPPAGPPPPSRPKGAPITGILSLMDRAIYARAGIPPDVAARYDDPEGRKLLADTLEGLGMPKMLMNTGNLSPTMRIGLIAAILGGYGFLMYSQAKVLREAMLKEEAAQKPSQPEKKVPTEKPEKQPLHTEKESPTMRPEKQPEAEYGHSIPNSRPGTPGTTGEGGSPSPSTGGI